MLIAAYGLTESTVVSFTNPKIENMTPGSVGSVIPNTNAKVVSINDTNLTLGPYETGELMIKGPQVMKGYHNRPEETKKDLIDGWLKTGDMAYYNEKEYFFITDRIKELIKFKGFQIPPAELEEIIRSFDNVADCAVIGIPHKTLGEVPRAYVVPKAKTKVNCEYLEKFVNSKVAEYKRLQGGIIIVDNIPKTPSGKILRKQLKEEYLSNC